VRNDVANGHSQHNVGNCRLIRGATGATKKGDNKIRRSERSTISMGIQQEDDGTFRTLTQRLRFGRFTWDHENRSLPCHATYSHSRPCCDNAFQSWSLIIAQYIDCQVFISSEKSILWFYDIMHISCTKLEQKFKTDLFTRSMSKMREFSFQSIFHFDWNFNNCTTR